MIYSKNTLIFIVLPISRMKKLFTILALLIFSFASVSYAQYWKWATGSICRKGIIESWPMAVDSAGNVYGAGIISSNLPDTSIKSIFGSDTVRGRKNVLLSVDSNGNYRWAIPISCAYIPTGPYSLISKISVGATGDIYIFGTFIDYYKIGTDSIASINRHAIFCARLTATGSVKWLKKVADNCDYNEGACGDIDVDGNAYVAGSFKGSSLTIGSSTLVNSGKSDVFITKLDTMGNPLWARSFGGDSVEAVLTVTTTQGGNVLVAGTHKSPSFSIGSTSFTNSSLYNYFFLVNYDYLGNFVWGKSITNSGYYSTIYNSTFDKWGNSYITGSYNNSISFGSTSLPGTGAISTFLAQYNSAGTYMWSRVFLNHYAGYSVIADKCANVFVSGATGYGYDHAFIANFDIFGTLLDSFQFNASGDDRSVLAVDNKGNLFIGADHYYNVSLGTDTLRMIDSTEEALFVAKYQYPFCDPNTHTLSTEIACSSNGEINLFPNPANNECTISFTNSRSALIRAELYDLSGRLMNKYQLNTNSSSISIKDIPVGAYFLKVLTDDENTTIRKLLIAR